MNKNKIYGWVLIFFILVCLPASRAMTDGGYVSRSQSVAVSADQRAIIIRNGNEISITFSTGYTGEGEDFGWVIPTPVIPAIGDIIEAGENGDKAFDILDDISAPVISSGGGGGCFPSGTEVLTANGPRAIEKVEQGTEIYSFDLLTGKWVLKKVIQLHSQFYDGDMITISSGQISIQATGNHPFYVLNGEGLDSRSFAKDIPIEEQELSFPGRWVEARDLKEGDMLQDKSGIGLIITSLSSRQEKVEVHNLNIEGCNNYAVHERGLLVHNKGGSEGRDPMQLVRNYGTIILEHYEVSILRAGDASVLLDWLEKNDYQVNRTAEEVLQSYADKNWAFVVVKLNPEERRHYENEFLPPLTIQYQHNQLIFPLHISSVSTTQNARITLYVIAESTVTSSNLPTALLQYQGVLNETFDPEIYIRECSQAMLDSFDRPGLIKYWGGRLDRSVYRNSSIAELMKAPFWTWKKKYLTRLETRIDPEAMTEDIEFILDRRPKKFQVNILAEGGYYSTLIVAAKVGDLDTVKELLQEGFNVHVQKNSGYTALIWAAEGGHVEIVEILLQAGAKMIVGDAYALSIAASKGQAEIVKILLRAGADVNAGGIFQALTYAAHFGSTETVQILLQAGADVNARDDFVYTALMGAANHGHIEVVKILLQAGADVTQKDQSGRTAYSIAVNRFPHIANLLLHASAED